MPKLKTHSSASKRFRITKRGKVKCSHAFGRHLMASKSPKRRRNLRKQRMLGPEDVKSVKRMLPYG